MKRIIIASVLIWVVHTSSAYAMSLHSLSASDKKRLSFMYSNLDNRLQQTDKKVDEAIQRQEIVLQSIDKRFQRMEDKFDTYFLWGYGTLLSLFLGALAWILNRIRSEDRKYYLPPSPGHNDGKQKYLFPSKYSSLK